MRTNRSIPVPELRKLIDYDPGSGTFTWRTRKLPKWDAKFAGKTAGSVAATGYVTLRIMDRAYLAHRVAWAMVTGEWPGSLQIDHIDGDRSNNRIANLRLATNAENAQNTGARSRNTSGYLGVVWFKPKRKWKAEIRAGGRYRHLGYFDDPAEAHAAYVSAKRELHWFSPEIRGGAQ